MKPTIVAGTLAFAFVAFVAPTAAGAFDQSYIPYQPGDPATNGCPSGWEALKVSDLTAAGYGLPSKIDTAGNNDNLVCGKPVSSAEETARFSGEKVPIIFDFRDNTLQPYGS